MLIRDDGFHRGGRRAWPRLTGTRRAAGRSNTLAAALAAAVVAGAATTRAAAAGPAFTDVTSSSGISYVQNEVPSNQTDPRLGDYPIETGGAAARDFDGDGWTDLVVSRFQKSPILYRNVADPAAPGGRRFADVTAASGLGAVQGLNGLAWGDVDRDGRPDLYGSALDTRHYLFMNKGNGQFAEEGLQRNADLTIPVPSNPNGLHGGMSVSFGDYDRDGYSDIAVGNWALGQPDQPNGLFQLLRNRGKAAPGHFEQTTYSAGVGADTDFRRLAFTPRFADLDNDGWTDLAVSSDFGRAKLFWNNKNGTFTDGTLAAKTGTESNAMGNTVGDFDRDGDLDWFTSSINGNRLYRNRHTRPGATPETRVFSDATDLGPTGVRHGGWGWGSSFLDYDLDGWQDIAQTNGYYGFVYKDDRTMLYRNAGGGGEMGFAESGVANGIVDTRQGRGLVVFDYDNDGAPDVFIVNNGDQPILYRNNKPDGASFLKFLLKGDLTSEAGSNPDAYGARVTLSDPLLGADMMLEVSGSSNYLGQNDPSLLFGLGQFTGTVDSVTVRWPNGVVQVFHDVAPNHAYFALEGADALTQIAVPEPAAVAVLGAGGGLLLLRRRRTARGHASN